MSLFKTLFVTASLSLSVAFAQSIDVPNSEVEALTAEIFGDMSEATKGDAELMKAKVEAAQRDPASFLNSLSPAHREEIRRIASELSKDVGTP
jgi:hypothetical protein